MPRDVIRKQITALEDGGIKTRLLGLYHHPIFREMQIGVFTSLTPVDFGISVKALGRTTHVSEYFLPDSVPFLTSYLRQTGVLQAEYDRLSKQLDLESKKLERLRVLFNQEQEQS